ncbi:hypothetical protein ACEPAI_7267 [Sanghuangporus weigelae]
MDARGGHCDVFVGYVRSESLRSQLSIMKYDNGKTKVAIKCLRVRLLQNETLAKSLARDEHLVTVGSSEYSTAPWALRIAQGLDYLHQLNIVHSGMKATGFVSTTHGGDHSKETKVWAYGMTLYEMISKELPYAHLKNDSHILSAIVIKGVLPSLLAHSPDDTHLSSEPYSTICSICASCSNRTLKELLATSQIIALLSP